MAGFNAPIDIKTAAEAMRRILIDNARHKKRLKRGGNRHKSDLDKIELAQDDDHSTDDLIALDEALTKLSEEDEAKAELVKLRYFAGLSTAQTADVLGISRRTVKRHWAYSRAWLLSEIE